MKMKLIYFMLSAIIIGLVLMRILDKDKMDDKFHTYSDLKKSGLIEKGWVPEFVPNSSRNIEVTHNIDTNFVNITLQVEESEIATYVNQLKAAGWHIT